jgi:hypothetical protein
VNGIVFAPFLLKLRKIGPGYLILVACIAGCAGPTAPTSGGTDPDARLPADARGTGAGPIDGGIAVDAAFRCRDRITTGLDNGHHNAGQDCQSGCHDHGFYMSGTMYSAANGGQAAAGVSITVIDADGNVGDTVSGTNGNFWYGLPVTFPVTIIASSCPDIEQMTAQVTMAEGGCNKGGCHAASGGAGRVHVP